MPTNYKLIKQLLHELIIDFSHVNRQIVEAYTQPESSARFKNEEMVKTIDQIDFASRKLRTTISMIRQELNNKNS